MGRNDNLAEQVYEQTLKLLRDRGVAGPMTLSDVSLAERLGVSRTPVRTALTRLECEGLLRRVPGKGWCTIPLTLNDIEEIFDLKELLEAHAAYKAAQNLTPEGADALLSVMAEMEEAATNGDQEAEMAVDRRYHDLVLSIAGNSRLTEFDRRLDSQWYPLRKGFITLQGGMKISCEEHRLITEAIVARDPQLAAERARTHHQRVRESLLNIVENVLMPFLSLEVPTGRP